MPALLVGACAVYLSVLAGDYVLASADPVVVPTTATAAPPAPAAPATQAERPAAAAAPERPQRPATPAPPPARVVAASAPVERRPEPKPAPAPAPVARPAATPLSLVQTRALTKAISRSGSALARTSTTWSPFATSSTGTAGTTALSPWTAPVTGYRLTARFGESGRRWASTHTGLDFAAPAGTAVVAVDAGVVLSAGWNGSYGQQVVLRHADGTETSYSHLSRLDVARGATVGRGQLVGRVGSTGNSTGPHLHLEVRPGGGDPVDPALALRQHGVPV